MFRRTLLALVAATLGCSGTEEQSCPQPPCDAPDAAIPVTHSYVVAPADQSLALTVGTPQTIAYTVTDSGVPVSGAWSLADGAIGSIDPVSGLFTANAVVGGTTTVLVIPTGETAAVTTTVTVRLSAIVPPPAGSDPGALFQAAGAPVTDTAAQANILYPLDKVVFPQNLPAPLVQWQIGNGSGAGGASDWYRLTYTKPHITVVEYAKNGAGFQFAAALPEATFARVAETDPTEPASLQIDRLDVAANRVVKGVPIGMTFARGSISGTVYYWAMDEARLHRLPAGTSDNQVLFPPNIVGTPATDPGYSYGSCIACHSISRDGRYLAANGDQAYVFDLTSADPTKPSMPVATRAGYRWYFASISPDDKRVFATLGDATFGYTDLSTKAVTPTGTLPTINVAHPAWSPDGKTVAYISNVQGWTSIASFTGGDLTIVKVDSGTDVFSGLTVIHQGSTLAASDPAGGNADCFPTWSPDAKFLMFAHTANTRGTGATRYDGSLYIMPPTAGATPVRLARASDSAGHALSHYPNTSPFISGGYYWIVFYSTRDYGNALAGTKGTNRPQLWVAAASTTFDGVTDPSAVPYWLPGQSTAHQNADAVWAASACKATGDACNVSSDCCSGNCLPGVGGAYVCNPPSVCRREGESCATSTDCCANLVCDVTIHTCQAHIIIP